MSYKLFLQIDVLPKSLNKGLRANRYAYNRANKAWDSTIYSLVYDKLPDRPLEKANLTFVRHSHRTLDFDGLVGSLKPVCDALVSAGVLKDDTWAIVGKWNVDQRFRPKSQGPLLEILVQEMPVNTDQN